MDGSHDALCLPKGRGEKRSFWGEISGVSLLLKAFK